MIFPIRIDVAEHEASGDAQHKEEDPDDEKRFVAHDYEDFESAEYGK
jgi:hypothetical protein